MFLPPRLDSRLVAGAALVPATVVAVLAFWSLSGPGAALPAPTLAATPSPAVAVAAGRPSAAGHVVVRGPQGVATVTLDNTAAARSFAALLPLRLTLRDPMGQAKSGQLPSPIDVTTATPVAHASMGAMYYWAPSNTLAIFYDDLGQTVPPPGLVRLGVVDSGLASVSSAGNRFTVRIEPDDRSVTRSGS